MVIYKKIRGRYLLDFLLVRVMLEDNGVMLLEFLC